jgi:hypothetical protein
MGRPRKYASNAEKQAAYRGRKKPVKKAPDPVVESVVAKLPQKDKCSAYVPHGTKCKLCGKSH